MQRISPPNFSIPPSDLSAALPPLFHFTPLNPQRLSLLDLSIGEGDPVESLEPLPDIDIDIDIFRRARRRMQAEQHLLNTLTIDFRSPIFTPAEDPDGAYHAWRCREGRPLPGEPLYDHWDEHQRLVYEPLLPDDNPTSRPGPRLVAPVRLEGALTNEPRVQSIPPVRVMSDPEPGIVCSPLVGVDVNPPGSRIQTRQSLGPTPLPPGLVASDDFFDLEEDALHYRSEPFIWRRHSGLAKEKHHLL
jgi:hypothetical protein